MADIHRQIDRLARRERGRLIAGLVARLGPQHLDLAEDVAQDALLSALSIWPFRGVPDNPEAWLTRVAGNKAIDQLRRISREESFRGNAADQLESGAYLLNDESERLFATHVADPELRLIILCCHPALAGVDQLALTLRIVSGFTARDMAEIFLSTPAAIAQRLSRGKRKLKQAQQSLAGAPSVFQLRSRLDTVLKTIYLMFSLGYSPRSGAALIRRDTAREALRLARELAESDATTSPEASAVAALLCFQASRLDAREDASGRPVLLKDQDRKAWDRGLINQGMIYLRRAMHRAAPGRYHLEAGIASIYACQEWDQICWPDVLSFYDQLEALTPSPVVTVNACVARAFAGNAAEALSILDQLFTEPLMATYAPFHIARAEILQLLDRTGEANQSYRAAISAGVSTPVFEHLGNRLAL